MEAEPDRPVVPSHSKGAAEEDAEVVGEAKYSPDKVGDDAILSADLGVPGPGLVSALTGPILSGGGAGAREKASIGRSGKQVGR